MSDAYYEYKRSDEHRVAMEDEFSMGFVMCAEHVTMHYVGTDLQWLQGGKVWRSESSVGKKDGGDVDRSVDKMVNGNGKSPEI